jgi:DNA polymerase III alpha subunit
MAEANRLGIPVRPPHINASRRSFTLTYEPARGKKFIPTLWMGLGQVRDLRRDSIKAIIKARNEMPFISLSDLLKRISFQKKELRHLIQCGGLDGLGDSRNSLLAEANLVDQAGAVGQLTFGFAQPEIEPETAADQLAWEHRILGQTICIHPLELAKGQLGKVVPLHRLPKSNGRQATIAGVRISGWTGGQGFFFGDGDTYIVVQGEKSLKAPKPWQVVLIDGRWQQDKWGTSWFEADTIRYPILD